MDETIAPFLAALVEHTDLGGGVAFLDHRSHWLFVDSTIAALHGVPAEAHLGRRPDEVAPQVWAGRQDLFARALAGAPVTFDLPDASAEKHGQGRSFRVDLFPVRDAKQDVIALGLTLHELATPPPVDHAAARRQDAVATLAEQALGTSATTEDICQAAAEQVAKTLRVPMARIVEVPGGSNQVGLRAGVGDVWNPDVAGPRSGSYVEYVMHQPQPVVVDDLPAEQRFRPPQALLDAGVRSSMAVAVRSTRGPWGMFSVHSREPRHFSDEEGAFLTNVAGVLSLAVQARESMLFQQELISMASHEMRTPLTTVVGMGQRLVRKLRRQAEDEPAELAQTIVEQALRLNSMIDRWLGVAEVQAGHIHPRLATLDLVDCVAGQVALARERHPTLSITEQYPSAPVEISTDGSHVTEILDNLTENAARYAGSSAHVNVTVERCGDRHVAVHVADDGPGVPPEARSRIFERFYRADRGGSRGLGLGLYVSRALAEELGGTLEVDGNVESGARFTLTLPT